MSDEAQVSMLRQQAAGISAHLKQCEMHAADLQEKMERLRIAQTRLGHLISDVNSYRGKVLGTLNSGKTWKGQRRKDLKTLFDSHAWEQIVSYMYDLGDLSAHFVKRLEELRKEMDDAASTFQALQRQLGNIQESILELRH